MNNVNYNKQMQNIIDFLGERKKLLLHCCCAPCSSACLEKLKDKMDITVFFYNPNMDSQTEYEKRSSEQERLCIEFSIPCKVMPFDKNEFLQSIVGLEREKEGGKRCFLCYEIRLRKTAEYAKQNGYDYFATTLTLSPLKNAQKLNEIGYKLQEELGVNYLPSDFKKEGGYLRSIELSKEYGLYRQSYCGCEFSKTK